MKKLVTNGNLKWTLTVIISAITIITTVVKVVQAFDSTRTEITILEHKTDSLKEDYDSVQIQIKEIKDDVGTIKQDNASMKTDVVNIKEQISDMKEQQRRDTERILEAIKNGG